MTVPRFAFMTHGVGRHKEKLQSFELALRDANIAPYNLVMVSSILPPACKIIPKEQGLKRLSQGEIVFCVMARNETNEKHRLIVASVGIAIPANRKSQYGYISEFHEYGVDEEAAADKSEDLAASMLATTLGVPFDPNQDWSEREQAFKMSGKFVKTTNVTQSATGVKGEWVTVVSAIVFVP